MNNHINKARAAAAAAAAKAAVADDASRAVNFVVTRREKLASSIIFNAVAKNGCVTYEESINALTQDAVALADATIRELYGKAGREAAGTLAAECFGQTEDKAVNFVVTRREQLASSIIFNAVAKNGVPAEEIDIIALAKDAVALADATIRELYGKAGRDAAGALAVECFGQKEDDAEKPAE